MRAHATALIGRPVGFIRTPFNRRESVDRRILINGKWTKLDTQGAAALAWLRANEASLPHPRLTQIAD